MIGLLNQILFVVGMLALGLVASASLTNSPKNSIPLAYTTTVILPLHPNIQVQRP